MDGASLFCVCAFVCTGVLGVRACGEGEGERRLQMEVKGGMCRSVVAIDTSATFLTGV